MTVEPNLELDAADDPSAALDCLDALLDQLVPSIEPAVVLTSLARLCVPVVSDSCTVEIVEEGGAPYLVDPSGVTGRPMIAGRPRSRRGQVVIPFEGAAHGATSYRGTMVFGWDHRVETALDAVIARILAGRSVALVAEQRLTEQARQAQDAVAHLRIALASSRVIGNAVGILMVAYKLTDDAAFDMLRELSQRTNRRVLDIANDVVMTGALSRE